MNKDVSAACKYQTNEDLSAAIDDYFNNICGMHIVTDAEGKAVMDKQGKPVFKVKPPTVTGLAYHLEFKSRQSIYDYALKGIFAYTIKRALLYCENFAEEQLYVNSHPVGAIFALKNRGWKDDKNINAKVKKTIKADKNLIEQLVDQLSKKKDETSKTDS